MISTTLAAEIGFAAGASLVGVGSRQGGATYAELLARDDVDAVYVGLATHVHAEWVAAALAAGKHVLCEKPLTTSRAQTEALFAQASAAGLLLVEACWSRWHPRRRRFEELLAAGTIGPVREVEAGFRFAGASGWRLEPPGGGALLDVGCYAIDAALVALGSEVEVSARLRRNAAGVDLAAEVLLDSATGATGQVRCAIDEPWAEWCVARGDGGELVLASPAFTAREWAPAVLEISDGTGTVRERFDPVPTYRLMVEAVSARIAGDPSAWVMPAAASLAVAGVLDSARGI
jgi:predicted dehydrogenase